MDSRKQKYIIIGALCLVVIGLSIGYAVLSANLTINGTADVQGGSWEVKFLNDNKIIDKKGLAVCTIGTISDTSITGMSASLKAPGDSCTFKVQAKNTGSLNAGLSDVENKDANLVFTGSGDNKQQDEDLLKSNVTYEVYYGDTQINSQTIFDNIPILKPDDEETIILRISFNKDSTKVPKEAVEVTGLDRTFIFGNIDTRPTTPEGTPVTCKVPSYVDTSGANAPVLNGDMIPVVYSENCEKWIKQDLNKSYDYANQVWANAVTVTSNVRDEIKRAPAGTPIEMADINTMWVWIPRYSYTIKSEDGGSNYYGKASFGNDSPSQTLPGEIDVKFISKITETGTAQYTGNTPTNWRTNEAFDFDGVKRSGIWVGKFEIAGSLSTNGQACVNELCNVKNVTIKPGEISLRSQTVSSFFYAARSIQKDNETFGFSNSGDLHMMKNDEWGVVAYLSQSSYGKYGNKNYSGNYKEIYQNKSNQFITGSSNGTTSQSNITEPQYAYNNMTKLEEGQGQAGPGASTTGNIYGIYDMSGGAWEYVMGVLAYYDDNSPMSGNSIADNSGFTGRVWQSDSYVNFMKEPSISFSKEKYYNLYKASTTKDEMPSSSTLTYSIKACDGRLCYGHALSETAGWYGNYAGFVYRESPWSGRGGHCRSTSAGVFYSSYSSGSVGSDNGSRFVLIS